MPVVVVRMVAIRCRQLPRPFRWGGASYVSDIVGVARQLELGTELNVHGGHFLRTACQVCRQYYDLYALNLIKIVRTLIEHESVPSSYMLRIQVQGNVGPVAFGSQVHTNRLL